jgi:hypothetical protein
MSEPLRYIKRLCKYGNGLYVLIPSDWKHHSEKEVVMEIYDDKIVITPVK